MRGQLILIEGLDRSGKSTQVEKLCRRLGNASVFRFPDRSTPIGALIDTYLRDGEWPLCDQLAHLLFSANRWERSNEICALLNEGRFVVLDRYVYSGMAYSLAKQTCTGAEQWLAAPDNGLPKPDLTLFLTLDVRELSSRSGWGQERYEKLEFQERVKECFMDILDSLDPTIRIIDVNKMDIERTHQEIWNTIIELKANEKTNEEILVFDDLYRLKK